MLYILAILIITRMRKQPACTGDNLSEQEFLEDRFQKQACMLLSNFCLDIMPSTILRVLHGGKILPGSQCSNTAVDDEAASATRNGGTQHHSASMCAPVKQAPSIRLSRCAQPCGIGCRPGSLSSAPAVQQACSASDCAPRHPEASEMLAMLPL